MIRVWIGTMEADGRVIRGSGCLRAAVPEPLWPFYSNPEAKSLMGDATDVEHAEVAEGRVVERVDDAAEWEIAFAMANSPDGNPFTYIKLELEKAAQAYQDEISHRNLWGRYGTIFDDEKGWITKGVSIT